MRDATPTIDWPRAFDGTNGTRGFRRIAESSFAIQDREKLEAILRATLRVTMPDRSQWDVPVAVIARDRAAHYADEYGGNVEASLVDDTLALFVESEYDICDWAAGNMNWSDVAPFAVRVPDPSVDPKEFARERQEGWVNGDKEVRR